MIEVKGLNKSFGEHHVLKNIDAQFHKGQVNIIIGQSGSGKTVLTKCMVGLHEVDSGTIEYWNAFSGRCAFRFVDSGGQYHVSPFDVYRQEFKRT
jgi:ABC-type polar amino acid transport system ATPase subunit